MMARDLVQLRLYIAGGAPTSAQAQSNLVELCRQQLPGRHEIEIIDVLREPQRALLDNVVLTPTLMKISPGPQRCITGSLNHLPAFLEALGLVDM
jgi:circadian clock protein KaiB